MKSFKLLLTVAFIGVLFLYSGCGGSKKKDPDPAPKPNPYNPYSTENMKYEK